MPIKTLILICSLVLLSVASTQFIIPFDRKGAQNALTVPAYTSATAQESRCGFERKSTRGSQHQCRESNKKPEPPQVSVMASSQGVIRSTSCEGSSYADPSCEPTSTSVQLTTTAAAPYGDELQYAWSTTGGRITGDGANVTWDLSGLRPGTYAATVEVNDGCGCVAYAQVTVTVSQCQCIKVYPSPVSEQPTSIYGVVTGRGAGALEGATVEAKKSGSGAALSATTTSTGRYVLSPLPLGTYTVTARMKNYKSSIKQATVGNGDAVEVNFELKK